MKSHGSWMPLTKRRLGVGNQASAGIFVKKKKVHGKWKINTTQAN